MTNRSPSTLTCFVRSLARSWWEGESGCYNGAGAYLGAIPFVGARAGEAVPGRVTDCALEDSGTPTAEITARCNRQGLPGAEGAGLLVRVGTDDYQGCDLPNRLHGTEPILDTGSGPAHCLTLRNGKYAIASAIGANRNVTVRVRSADGTSWVTTTVTGTLAQEPWPALEEVVTETGATRLLLVHYDGVQVHAWWSADDGVTWSDGGQVLETVIPSTHPWATRGRIRIKWNPATGQILLVFHTRSTTAVYLGDVLYQAASSDGGGIFQRVEHWDGSDSDNCGGYPDIALRDGVFYVGYLRKSNAGIFPVIAMVADAWDRIRTAESVVFTAAIWLTSATVTVGAPDVLVDGELALWADDDLSLYLTIRDVTDGSWRLARNTRISTLEADWYSTGGVTHQVWSAPNGGVPLSAVAASRQHGRSLIVYDLDDTGELHVGQLGGWSSVPLPSISGTTSTKDRISWDMSTPWNQLPTSCWLAGYVGAQVQNVGYVAATGAGTYTDTGLTVGTLAEGVICEHDIMATAGAAGTQVIVRACTGTAVASHVAEVRITDTAMALFNATTGVQIGAAIVYPAGRVHVLLAVSSAGARAFYRSANPISHETAAWVEIGAGAIAAAAASFNYIDLQITAVATVRLYHSAVVAGAGTGQQLVSAPTVSSRHPRTLVPSGIWCPAYHTLLSDTGPAIPGDTWVVPIDYEFGPNNLDPRGDFPSPSAPCLIETARLPAGTTEIRLSWTFTASDNLLETDILGIYADGVLSRSIAGKIRAAGAWSAWCVMPADTVGLTADSTGINLVADPAAAAGAYDWIRGDLDNAGCTMVNGVLSEARIIVRSRGGSTKTTSTWPLGVELDQEPAFDPTSMIVWPRRGLHLKPLGQKIRGFQLSIPVAALGASPGRPAGGYYGLSVLAVGPALAAGMQAAIAPRSLSPGVQITTARDGTKQAAITGPAARTLEMRWAPIPFVTRNDSVSSSSTGAQVAVASRQDLDDLVELQAHEGALYPGVAVADYARTAAGEWHITNRGADFLYGRIVGNASTEPIGDGTKAARFPGWVIEEEP